MHMAVAENYDTWIAEHTFLCLRLSARITLEACASNQVASVGKFGDGRCAGCNGHNSQPAPGERIRPTLVAVDPVDNGAEDEQDCVLSEEPHCEYELHEPELDEEELEAQLLELFPEAKEYLQESFQERPVSRRRKYAVYKGRCRRCGGYMVRDIEGQFDNRDEDIHRCWTCGWRTSPLYEWNRNRQEG